MDIVILKNSETPLKLQIYDSIAFAIMHGKMVKDEALPSIRALSIEIGVSVITVKAAFDALETDGYIYTVQGRGSFVKGAKSETADMKMSAAKEKLTEPIKYCKKLGLKVEDITNLICEIYAKE